MELGVICPYLSNTQRSKRVKIEKLELQARYLGVLQTCSEAAAVNACRTEGN